MKDFVKRLLPRAARRALARWWHSPDSPATGAVDWGELRRLTPISSDWGFDRGTAIDRFWIHRFLADNASYIRGRVLEIGNADLTKRYGSAVTRSDVLHVVDSGPHVTIVSDLATGAGIPDGAFDCAIITQTLQLIPDPRAAARTLHRILTPRGVALVTVPGITKISRYDMERWGQYWSFTSRSAREMFEDAFPGGRVTVQAHGNVLSAAAFLYGIAAEELTEQELVHHDPDFEVLLTIRAERAP